jgi:hypothetical protein
MRMTTLCLLLAGMMPQAFAAEPKTDPVSVLDAKITKKLAQDQWDEAGRAFVRALWKDYKQAHRNPQAASGERRSLQGDMPDVKSYDEYVGSFSPAKRPGLKYMEVVKDEAGRYFVKLGPHTIPAAPRGGTMVFTTGDVGYSNLPRLAEKYYCTLEIYMLVRVEGKYYFTDLATRPSASRELVKATGQEKP